MNSGTTQDLYSITYRDSLKLIACGANGTIIRSTNGGTNWIPATSGTTSSLKSVSTVPSVFQPSIIAAGSGGTIVLSTNNGETWSVMTSNTSNQLNSILFFFNGVSGYNTSAMGNNGTLKTHISSTWDNDPQFPVTTENLTGSSSNAAGIYNVLRFLCTEGGKIFKVRNTLSPGAWQQINSGVTSSLRSIHSQADLSYNSGGKKIWAAGDNGVIRYSADTGNTWQGQSISTTENLYSIYMIDSLRGWISGSGGFTAATTNGGGNPIGILQTGNFIPVNYDLSQNYPNPFNPITNIKFQLPNSGFVKLTVFDMLGREVETLVNENLSAGTYNVDWKASKYSSGVYFYKLQSGDYSEIKKMILVK